MADRDYSRKIFQGCSADLVLVLSHNPSRLLRPTPKSLRIALLPLFTTKALSIYIHIQQKVIRAHLTQWCQLSDVNQSKGLEMRPLIDDLNMSTSLSVFLGPYVTESTRGMFTAPIYLPGSQLNRRFRAANSIPKSLETIVAQSKQRMGTGNEETTCLLNFWMISTVKSLEDARRANAEATEPSSHEEIAKITLDFLFAAMKTRQRVH
jgi:sterol 22-desaturase